MVVQVQQRMENLTHRNAACIVEGERRLQMTTPQIRHKKTPSQCTTIEKGGDHCTNEDGMTPNPWELYHSTHMSARLIIRADYLCLTNLMIFCCT